MYISSNTKKLLRQKLHFNMSSLDLMAEDMDLSAKALGYLQIIQSKSIPKVRKKQALNNLQFMRVYLERLCGSATLDLKDAYEDHYSFQRDKKSMDKKKVLKEYAESL